MSAPIVWNLNVAGPPRKVLGRSGCLAAALGLEELQGRHLQPQQEEEAPAAIQETETLRH